MKLFLVNTFGNLWATVLMSVVPLIELKGGIVFARTPEVGFTFFKALLLAYIGSTLVFIPIFFLLKPILNLLKKIKWFKGFALKVENYFALKAQNVLEKRQEKGKGKSVSEKFLKQLGVFIFVAVPLPMTGVWAGTAIAVFLNLDFKDVIIPILLGNLIAGVIISILAELCLGYLDYILYGLFALALILLIVVIVKVSSQKPKEDK